MKPPIVILALLFGAFALGDLASCGYVNATHQRWPDLPSVILLGLAFSQLLLVAVWFAFGRWNVVVRLLSTFAIVFGLAFVASSATDGANSVAPWFAVQLVAVCSFSVPFWVARLFGWQINLEGQSRAAARMPGWQFSIWGMLSATTAAAIVLGMARLVDMPLLGIGEAFAFFGCIGLTGLLAFVAAMGIRTPEVAAMVTLPVVVLICPLLGMLIGQTGLPPAEDPPQWALFGFCYGATIAVAVLALRIAGYRLERGAVATPAADDSFGQGASAKCDAEVDEKPTDEIPAKSEVAIAPDALSEPRLAIHRKSDEN